MLLEVGLRAVAISWLTVYSIQTILIFIWTKRLVFFGLHLWCTGGVSNAAAKAEMKEGCDQVHDAGFKLNQLSKCFTRKKNESTPFVRRDRCTHCLLVRSTERKHKLCLFTRKIHGAPLINRRLTVGQNEQFKDVSLFFWKLLLGFFHYCHTFSWLN